MDKQYKQGYKQGSQTDKDWNGNTEWEYARYSGFRSICVKVPQFVEIRRGTVE